MSGSEDAAEAHRVIGVRGVCTKGSMGCNSAVFLKVDIEGRVLRGWLCAESLDEFGMW